MKKFLSILLALVMILSLATVVFADEGETEETEVTVAPQDFFLKKVWTVTGAHGDPVYPDQDIEFSVTAYAEDAPTVTFKPLNAAEATPKTDEYGNTYFDVVGTVSGVTDVGEWHYTVTETGVSAQGTLAVWSQLELVVYATYGDNGEIKITVGGKLVDGKKYDTFTNFYQLGTLSVKKEVSGSAGKKDVYFDIDVTFTASRVVASEITISDGSSTIATIATSNWILDESGSYTVTKTVSLKHDQTVYFYNVPDGVNYTVVEQDKHRVGTDGIVDINDYDGDYSVTYTNDNGNISADAPSAAVVKNEKNASTETGIVLDSMPYILLLAVAAAGLFVLLNKKRVNEF